MLENEQQIGFSKQVARKEYLTSGIYLTSDMLTSLSYDSDRMTAIYGSEIISSMLRDPEISAAYTVIKVGVLSNGISFIPAISKPPFPPEKVDGETKFQTKRRQEIEKESKRYEIAKTYSDFLNRCLTLTDKPIVNTIESLLEAFYYGNKVAEKVYDEFYDTVLKRTILAVRKFRMKPRESFNFVVNSYNELVGLSGYTQNNTKVILPKEKFLIFTFAEHNDDPRGQSMFEAVYNAWWMKTQVFPEYLKWLEQCAIPGLIGVMPPDSGDGGQILDADGNIKLDQFGRPVTVDPASEMLKSLAMMRNSSIMVIPNGAEVTPLGNTATGNPFSGMLNDLNGEIVKGLLLQQLATSDSRHNTRAASQTQISVLDGWIFFIKERLIDVILYQYVFQMIELNFPDFDRELLPRVSMGDTTARNFESEGNTIANLKRSGFIHPSQELPIDSFLGLPMRDISFDDNQTTDATGTMVENPPATVPVKNTPIK